MNNWLNTMLLALKEAPPTAGLTLCWRDFLPSWPAQNPAFKSQTLESSLAQFIGVTDTQIECSGTAALVVALLTLKKLSPRREVVISAYTCPWVAIAVVHCGLKPVLCDTQKNHFQLDLSALNQVANSNTLAIVPTHLAGRVAELVDLIALAKSIGAYVVEDAAQSLGAKLNGKPVGLLGDIGFYSLGVGKGLTIFAGGVLVARDENMQLALRETSAQTIASNKLGEVQRIIELLGYYLFYQPLGLKWIFGMQLRRQLKAGKLVEAVGDNCASNFLLHKVGNWRKNVGAHALRRLPEYLASTCLQAECRKQKLEQLPHVTVIADATHNQGVWPFLIVLMPTQKSRDDALNILWQQGLGVGRLFIHALGDYDYLAHHFDGSPINSAHPNQQHTPNAQDFAARTLIITNSPWLSEVGFTKIVATLKDQISKDEMLEQYVSS